jgi:DNA-binding NarL/FixJ family response regulator
VEPNQVAVLHGDDEFAARTGHLFAATRATFSCVVADPGTWARASARHGASVPARVTVQKLLSPAVLASQQYREQLRRLMAAGAEVRLSGSALPHETIIIDQRIAIIAGGHTPAGRREYTVTTAPTLVAGVSDLFQAAWAAATDFSTYLTGETPLLLDDSARVILRALGDGLTDEAASRRLGVSLRTYRRRVADLMIALDADSRFQAGLHAGELGLGDAPAAGRS